MDASGIRLNQTRNSIVEGRVLFVIRCTLNNEHRAIICMHGDTFRFVIKS